MAKGSEKKRATTASATTNLYLQIIAGLYAVYILTRIFFFWSSFTFSIMLGFVVISVVNYFALTMLTQALEMGTSVSGPQDVLFVNWFVMALSILTDKAFYFYLVIPGYLIYQYGGFIKNYLFPPKPENIEMPLSEADKKRQDKKERQAARLEKFQRR